MKEKFKIFAVSTVAAVSVSSMGFAPSSFAEHFDEDENLTVLQAEQVISDLNDKDNSNNELSHNYSSNASLKDLPKATAPKEKVKPLQVRYDYSSNSSLNSKNKDKKESVIVEDHMMFNTDGLTDEQVDWIMTAAKLSKQKIPAAFFRAVAEQESDITPDVFAMDRNGGTWGIWQINEYHVGRWYDGGDFETDKNNNGTPDVQEPMIAAKIAAAYFDDLYLELEQMRKDYPDEKWAKELTEWESLAVAHNAGPTGMRKYPNFAVPEITDKYLDNMRTKIPAYMKE